MSGKGPYRSLPGHLRPIGKKGALMGTGRVCHIIAAFELGMFVAEE
jgi:hypothetical protein